jgi:hypothetical protein
VLGTGGDGTQDGGGPFAGNPGGGSGGGGSDSAPLPGTPATPASPAEPSDSPPDSSSAPPRRQDLAGVWIQDDAPGQFYIAVEDGTIRAHRGQPWVCLPTGPAPSADGAAVGSPQNEVYFQATADGRHVQGQVAVCWYGGDEDPHWAPAPLELSLADDGNRLTGTWQDDARGRTVDLALARQPAPELTAEDFGLPGTNLRIYDYGAKRAFRADGTIVSVPNDYAQNSESDEEVLWHMGIDFASRDERWIVTSLPFTTPVGGIAHVFPESPWKTFSIRLDTGDELQFLHAGEIHVQTGDRVEAGTILGKTGATGAATIHLHVQAKDANGDVASPDWVIARARPPSR